jgi:hypothetical protein
MSSKPRRLALVKFRPPAEPALGNSKKIRYPFKEDEAYVFLGEIPNMPGHCVVAERIGGKLYAGYHSQLFTELSDDEV